MATRRDRTRSVPLHLARRRREGSYAFLLVLTMPVLLGMGAVAVDLSYQKVVRAELQGAADIAAAAGTELLDGTAEGMDAARAAAIRAAARNTADGRPVELTADAIEFGSWHPPSLTFTPTTDPEAVDAMRVTLTRDDVPATFATMLRGGEHITARGVSVATQPEGGPAGGVSCYIPLAVADCLFDEYTPEELTEMVFKLNPAGIDNVGWARVGASPNASWTRDQIRDCHQDGVARVGDEVGLQNGVVTSAMSEMATAIAESDTVWDTAEWGPQPAQVSRSAVASSAYGHTYEGVIIVFDGGDEYCEGGGGPFNQFETIVGFAWAEIYDIRTQGAASGKNIWLRLDPLADEEVGTHPGGLVDGGVYRDEPVRIVD